MQELGRHNYRAKTLIRLEAKINVKKGLKFNNVKLPMGIQSQAQPDKYFMKMQSRFSIRSRSSPRHDHKFDLILNEVIQPWGLRGRVVD